MTWKLGCKERGVYGLTLDETRMTQLGSLTGRSPTYRLRRAMGSMQRDARYTPGPDWIAMSVSLCDS